MGTTQVHSVYRDRLQESLQDWPEFTSLNGLLHSPTPPNADETEVYVSDISKSRVWTHKVENKSELQTELLADPEDTFMRLVLLCHTGPLSIDRNILDLVADHFALDPRILASHLDYASSKWEVPYSLPTQDKFQRMDYDPHEHKHSWPLSSIICPSAKDPLSTLKFTYGASDITFIIQNGSLKRTILVLLRESKKESALSIYWPLNKCDFTSQQIEGNERRFRSIKDHVLSGLEHPPEEVWSSTDFALDSVVSLFIDTLVGNAYGVVHRYFSPDTFDMMDRNQLRMFVLFKEMRRVQQLKRQVSSYVLRDRATPVPHSVRALSHVLDDLCQDLYQLQALADSDFSHSWSIALQDVMETQTQENKKSMRTSAQIGSLSRLAYIFLPLQLTTSILGMNLQIFGSGTSGMPTFVGILILLCALSFLPVVLPNFKATGRGISAWQYSRRVGLLYALFSFTHTKLLSDLLWDCGISSDLEYFSEPGVSKRNVGDPHWKNLRQMLFQDLKEERFSLFPTFWEKRLGKIFEIIDKPQWGKEKLHRA